MIDVGGVTDRHVVVSKTDILKILDVLPSFLSKPFEDTIPLDNNGMNPKRILKQSIEVEEVPSRDGN